MVAVARRRERLEALQQNLVRLGVPIADFLPVVCDITKVPFKLHCANEHFLGHSVACIHICATSIGLLIVELRALTLALAWEHNLSNT